MDLAELRCIISKFDSLSDYSESETEIFKHTAPSNLQSLLRPCLKQPQQPLIGTTTTSEEAGVATQRRKTARFAAAHLLAKCLVTGKIVPTREQERAASIDEDGLDMRGGDRRRQQRRQKRAKKRAGQKHHGGGGNLLDDELAFHKDVDDEKGTLRSFQDSETTSTKYQGSGLREATASKDELSTNVETETSGSEDKSPFTEEGNTWKEKDPEEAALDGTLVEACRNAAINSGDVAPLQGLEKFAWQSRWAVSRTANNLDLNS
ncbi:hypothetical protein PspLS_11317 [Pyricularia sp. CBS 133598]|nr:hypothetical protein PspLS_11317 [Pyricularia sp. CBS 133598]